MVNMAYREQLLSALEELSDEQVAAFIHIAQNMHFIEIVREQCGATLGLTACNNYCIKKGGDFNNCMSTCQSQLMPFSMFNFETCTCTITEKTCTDQGKSFLKELCLCQ